MTNNVITLIGDATNPQTDGKKIIAHVCNDVGRWGAGFVLALSKKWSKPEEEYKRILPENLQLGLVQYVDVEDDIIIANMIGQHDTKSNRYGVPPIRYGALKVTLNNLFQYAQLKKASVHMPMIGAGLAGGDWNIISKLINDAADKFPDVKAYIYEFPVK